MEYKLIFVICFEICQVRLINMPDKQIFNFTFIYMVTKKTSVLHFITITGSIALADDK